MASQMKKYFFYIIQFCIKFSVKWLFQNFLFVSISTCKMLFKFGGKSYILAILIILSKKNLYLLHKMIIFKEVLDDDERAPIRPILLFI